MAALLAGPPPAPGSSAFTYRFDEVKSRVYRWPEGDKARELRVKEGESAVPGDTVITGFWAHTLLSVPERKARFEISSSARARLAVAQPGVLLVLERGRLKAFFETLTDGPAEERQVAVPGALLAVRGTRYGVEVDGGGNSSLAVFEGTVEVTSLTAGFPPFKVPAGGYCTFGPKGPPQMRSMGSMGMSEGSWGHGGMSAAPGGMDSRMPGSSPGGGMQRGSHMGPKGH